MGRGTDLSFIQGLGFRDVKGLGFWVLGLLWGEPRAGSLEGGSRGTHADCSGASGLGSGGEVLAADPRTGQKKRGTLWDAPPGTNSP